MTIGLSASGDTVSAKWGNTVVATQQVATVGRATTDIGTVANDTNDTLTITATNSQGTGYVVADSNKNTASKVVTLGIAKPIIDKNTGIVTAVATVQDNSTTPVKVEKTSDGLSLGLSSLSVNGPTVTSSEGFTTGGSATVATVSRATTSLGSTVTNNKLVFTATNNQGTGYVVASTAANNAIAEVTLSVSGNEVTASHGTNTISATVAAANRADTTIGLTATNENEIIISASNTYPTGYVTGETMSATASATVSIDNTPVYHNDGAEYYTITSVTTVSTGSGESATSQIISKTTQLDKSSVTTSLSKYDRDFGEEEGVPIYLNVNSSKGYINGLSEQRVVNLKEIEENLKPENIRLGIKILGITGTCVPRGWDIGVYIPEILESAYVLYTQATENGQVEVEMPLNLGENTVLGVAEHSAIRVTYVGNELRNYYLDNRNPNISIVGNDYTDNEEDTPYLTITYQVDSSENSVNLEARRFFKVTSIYPSNYEGIDFAFVRYDDVGRRTVWGHDEDLKGSSEHEFEVAAYPDQDTFMQFRADGDALGNDSDHSSVVLDMGSSYGCELF